ncbi:Low density lipoprotein-receptor domain containing protein [Aphelenchoides besseyi]|nr:Low density lipoprotein-receptor domain containing protein [Aphelenchoides besseyi]
MALRSAIDLCKIMVLVGCGIVLLLVFTIKFLNRFRKRKYTVNPMDTMLEERKVKRGCWAWCCAKADAFRIAVARTCCDCCAAIPSIVLVLMAIFVLVLILSAIPLAVVISYMAPQVAEGWTQDLQLEDVARQTHSSHKLFQRLDNQSILSTLLLKPPNVTSCVEYGFSCTKTPGIIISFNQLCDGEAHCPDGSDELECEECLTAFSCPPKPGSHRRHCLRGAALCDGRPDCHDQSDELLYCSANCEPDHYKCKSADRCIPADFRCDGDAHCPGGDDEDECAPKDCRRGSKFCSSTNKCIPVWQICDGVNNCDNAADEMDCDCKLCASSESALCTKSNMCIEKSQVCDGVIDCLHGEDEEHCAGQCEFLADIRANDVVCADGKNYAWEYACSGLYPQCNNRCEDCNPQLAIKCDGGCLHRSRVCNGQIDCSNGEDEDSCPEQCDHSSRVCDGFSDCADGRDEQRCTKCHKSAIHCRADNKCIPSHMRCDGTAQCSDGQDELKCDCKDCAIHPHSMYFCAQSERCFRMDDVCQPRTKCPNPSRMDKMFCATQNSTLHYF